MPGAASIARVFVACSALVACGALVSIEGYDLAPGSVVVGPDGGLIVSDDGEAHGSDGSTGTELDALCSALVAYETIDSELHMSSSASTGANTVQGRFGNARAYSPAQSNETFNVDKTVVADMTRGAFVLWLFPDGWVPCNSASSSAISVGATNSAHMLTCESNGSSMSFFGWVRRTSSGAARVELPNAQNAFSTSRDGWSFVAVVWDEKTAGIYVNGMFNSTATTVSGSGVVQGVTVQGVNPFRGPTIRVDEMRLFDRSLSKAELDYIYTSESAGVPLEKSCPAK
jgi:hypothetical protein